MCVYIYIYIYIYLYIFIYIYICDIINVYIIMCIYMKYSTFSTNDKCNSMHVYIYLYIYIYIYINIYIYIYIVNKTIEDIIREVNILLLKTHIKLTGRR